MVYVISTASIALQRHIYSAGFVVIVQTVLIVLLTARSEYELHTARYYMQMQNEETIHCSSKSCKRTETK
jgi:predicted transcriptional regulator